MQIRDDEAVFELPPDPVGVLVLRAQRTPQGLRIRVTSTFDVERSPQGTTQLFAEVQLALADVASWLSSFATEPGHGSGANTEESTRAGGTGERSQ
jgi:hypothetical protein